MNTSPSYLDVAAKAACAARTGGRFDRAQVNKLLEVLEGAEEKEAIQVLLAFIARQVSRNYINRDAGRFLTEYLLKIQNKDEARKFLGMFKWLYEAAERSNLRGLNCFKVTFEEFIKTVSGLR